MKKLILLSAVFGLMAFALSGCSNGGTFTEKTYSTGDIEIQSVILLASDRELEISASKDNQIYIDYFDSEKEYLFINISESKELTVKLQFNKNWTDYFGTKPPAEYRKIKMRIPDNLIVAFSASTTNEDIKISPLSFRERVDLSVNGGDIICESLNIGEAISLTAKNGNICGTVIGSFDDFSIFCKIKKGKCNLPEIKEGGKKSFSADCNNGDINITFVK